MIKALFFSIIIFLLVGCSSTISIPEKVYIPIKCNVDIPTRPTQVSNNEKDYVGIVRDVQNILIYTETLESKLNFCVKGQ